MATKVKIRSLTFHPYHIDEKTGIGVQCMFHSVTIPVDPMPIDDLDAEEELSSFIYYRCNEYYRNLFCEVSYSADNGKTWDAYHLVLCDCPLSSTIADKSYIGMQVFRPSPTYKNKFNSSRLDYGTHRLGTFVRALEDNINDSTCSYRCVLPYKGKYKFYNINRFIKS